MTHSQWRRAVLCGLVLGAGLPGSRLLAQAAAVMVRDGAGGPPVAGAIVRLFRGDSVLAQGLTTEAGRVTLRAPSAGRYVLRVSRIGYAVGDPMPVELAAGETQPVELAAAWSQIFLPEIIVEARSACGRTTEERALAATLWEQIRQALTATSISERSGLTLNTRIVDRILSASGTIREEDVSPPHLTGSRPFLPVPPERLAEFGYVRADADSVVYNAPDAESLLTDPFVGAHCFGVRAGQKADSLNVGLTFEPLKTTRVSDIRGVLWVDRRSLELRSLEFHYVSSNQSVLESNAWGRLEFDKLPTGPWYIRTWFIRMPEIVRTIVKTTFHDAVDGFREHGGRAELDGSARAVAARLSGRVTDSLGGGGLAGVVVSVAGVLERAVTDSLGDYALAVPVSGSRIVTFAHPLLALDSTRGRQVVELVPGRGTIASTSTPGPTVLLRTLCPGEHGRSGVMGRAIIGGGATAPRVYVRANWSLAGAPAAHDEATVTDDAGLWSFCDLPAGAAVSLRVGGQRGGAAIASATIEDGRFRSLTLPATASDIGPVAQIDSAQRLPELKTTGRVPVSASARFDAELRDRMQRNGAPPSALITRDELEKSRRFRLSSLLVSHGLKSRINKYGKQTLTCPRTAERPTIFVDGLLVDGSDTPTAKVFRMGAVNEIFDMENLAPDDVEAVEVYRSRGEWPAQFDHGEASCVVVIWTRRPDRRP